MSMCVRDLKKEVCASFPSLRPNFRVINHLNEDDKVAPEERAYFIATICAESEHVSHKSSARNKRVNIGAVSC